MRKLLLTAGFIASCSVIPALQVQSVSHHKSSASQKAIFYSSPASLIPTRYAKLQRLAQKTSTTTAPKTASVLSRPKTTVTPVIADIPPLVQPVVVAAEPQILPVLDQADIKQVHKEIANEVLMQLPERCRDALQSFYVRYDNPKQRGLAGKTTMILTGNVSDEEFRALFVHEIGHVFDLNPNPDCLGGTAYSGTSEFTDGPDPVYQNDPSLEFYRISWEGPKTQRSNSKPEDFVSGYASWDPFEDFAESMAYFVLHNELFYARAQTNERIAAKYRWFNTYLFPQGIDIASTEESPTKDVPWDITKLSYSWHPEHTAVAWQ